MYFEASLRNERIINKPICVGRQRITEIQTSYYAKNKFGIAKEE